MAIGAVNANFGDTVSFGGGPLPTTPTMVQPGAPLVHGEVVAWFNCDTRRAEPDPNLTLTRS